MGTESRRIRRNSEETLVNTPNRHFGETHEQYLRHYPIREISRREECSEYDEQTRNERESGAITFGRNFRDNDTVSILSESASTVTEGVKIFGSVFDGLGFFLNLPVVCSFLHQDVTIMNTDTALLHTSTSVLSIFKKNSPFITIYRAKDSEKTEFCRAYFKVLDTNLSCYIVLFSTQNGIEPLVLMINGIKPCADFIWKGTKCRVLGVTGMASTFGSGSISIHVLSPGSPSLVDDLSISHSHDWAIKNIKVNIAKSNILHQSVIQHDRRKVVDLFNQAEALFNSPLASFYEERNSRDKDNLIRNGTIKIFEQTRHNVSEDSLILASIILVLREQELNKNKGNKKTV